MARAGLLRRRILVEAPVVSRAASGAAVETYAKHAELWARMEQVSSREYQDAVRRWSAMTALFTVRWRSDLTEKMRVLHEGRVYRIVGRPYDPADRRDTLLIPCEEVR